VRWFNLVHAITHDQTSPQASTVEGYVTCAWLCFSEVLATGLYLMQYGQAVIVPKAPTQNCRYTWCLDLQPLENCIWYAADMQLTCS